MGKGTRREREAVSLLKRAGYATYRPATVRFGENDVFGLFDVLACGPDKPFRAVQVKSNRAIGIRSWRAHTALWRSYGMRTEYWVPIDREGWRVIDCRDDGTETVVDERQKPCEMGDGVVQWLRHDAQ